MTTLGSTDACHGFSTHLACLKPNYIQHTHIRNGIQPCVGGLGMMTRADVIGQFIMTAATGASGHSIAKSKSVHWACGNVEPGLSCSSGPGSKTMCYQDMVTCKTFADLIGLTKFRDDRQELANVAIARAKYIGIDTVDEDDIFVQPTVGLVESVLQQVDKKLGNKKHCTKHRTANRWAKRAVIVKCLVETVKFKAPAVFTASRADLACLRLVVRQVIDEAVKDGVEHRGKVMNVRKEERNYYLKAVASAYFIEDEDSAFWDALASSGEAITA